MDRSWSPVRPAHLSDPLDVALAEIDVAIELVLRGQARRVHLVSLTAAERVAAAGLARAQGARVRFALEREAAPGRTVSILIGPVIDG